MRKSLLLAAFLMGVQLNALHAQLFTAPDTICVRQPVFLNNLEPDAASYYWGFCSGYLGRNPEAFNMGSGFGFDTPGAIEIASDSGRYIAFVANRGTTELLRLDFGSSMANTPAVTSLGNLNNTLPQQTSSLYMARDSGKWYLFAAGGTNAANSSLARFDLGTSLRNVPNSVNFFNPGNVLDAPRGIVMAREGNSWNGFMINRSGALVRMTFGTNISTTPILTTIVLPAAGISQPGDMKAIQEGGNWHLLVTNTGSNTLSRIDLGNSLTNNPVGVNMGNLGGRLFGPTALSVVRDCGAAFAFITNSVSSDLIRADLSALTAATYPATNLGNLGNPANFSGPAGMTRVVRERDSLFAFVVNQTNNSLTQVVFPQCSNASIPSSQTSRPPVYTYSQPGIYNVYVAINEGLPDARVECRSIVVLPQPPMSLSNDTLICQGDTIELVAQAYNVSSYRWRPYYNISDSTGVKVNVHPEYDVRYGVTLSFPNGCIVDTGIQVNVTKVKADAGPDRVISDGSKTILGGPGTATGPEYVYNWTPNNQLSSTTIPNPVAKPERDFTYYLQVINLSNGLGCADVDTVVVRVSCGDINLPNAFSPESRNNETRRFGLMNHQLVKLNAFRIYDRWGKKVFEASAAGDRWDGTVDGEPAPFGVYVWEADGFCVDGQRVRRTGNVTLMR